MKKKVLSIICLMLALVMVLPLVSSANIIAQLEHRTRGTVTDSGEGYYILTYEEDSAKNFGIEQGPYYIDENCEFLDRYLVELSSHEIVDIDAINNGTEEFFGIAVKSIDPLFNPETADSFSVYTYVIVLEDTFGGAEAEAILSQREEVVSYHRNYASFTLPDSILGDMNYDEEVDMFDYLLVKSIYFETYTPNEQERITADINIDGTIDLFDYMEIKAMCFE